MYPEIVIIIRIVGLIALAWTNFPVAVGAFLALIFIDDEKDARKIVLIKNGMLRNIVEWAVLVLALAGMWYFPLIDANIAHSIAAVSALLLLAHYVNLFIKVARHEI